MLFVGGNFILGRGIIHLGKKIVRRFDKQGNFAVAVFHDLVL